MMKRKIQNISILVVLLFLSCQNKEEILEGNSKSEMKFDVLTTRAENSVLSVGDEVGIYVLSSTNQLIDRGNYADNKHYIMTDKGLVPASDNDKIFCPTTENFKIIAYSPYKPNFTPRSVIESPGNQQKSIKDADFMIANYTGAINNYNIPLYFKHIMALIEVNCCKDVKSVVILNRAPFYSIDWNNGRTNDAVGVSKPMLLNFYAQGDKVNTFRVLVPAQNILLGQSLFQLTFSDNTRKLYYSKEALSLVSGNKTTYNLSNQYKVILAASNNQGSPSGSGIFDASSTATINANPNTGYFFSGWYENDVLISTLENYTFSVIKDINITAKYAYNEIIYDLNISPTSYTFVATGGSKNFSVVCNKTTKTYINNVLTNTVTSPITGYTTSVTGDGFSVVGNKVNATDNNSTDIRTGTFSATVAGITKSVSFDQEGKIIIDTNINP